MFHTTHIGNTMILTPDVVRMTSAKEQIIRDFAAQQGTEVSASIDSNVDGSLKSVDLFGGTVQQRESFREAMVLAVLG